MLRVFEAFSGIGTQRMALRNLGIEHEVVCIAEIDKFAIRSYEAIHGETLNLGDVSKIDPNDVPDHDLFTYSFPCQDISVAGKGKGFKPESGTRSSLLWECEKIIEAKKPKYLLMENVKALIFKKFKPGFEKWLRLLEELGYTNYWQVLNAKDYGIPQNRERVFVVSIRKDVDTGDFTFPEGFDNGLRLKDFLEDEVDEKFYISQEKTEKLINQIKDKNISNTIRASGRGSVDRHQRDMVCVGNVNPSGRGMNGNVHAGDIAPTLTTNKGEGPKMCTPCITPDREEKRQNGRRFKEDGDPMFTLTGQDRHGVLQVGSFDKEDINDNERQRRVYSEEGISPTILARTDNAKILQVGILDIKGNEQIRRVYGDNGLSPTLNSMQGGNRQPKVMVKQATKQGTSNTITTVQKDNLVFEPQYRIRKLTPKECWRLMGISNEDFEKAQEVNSNTQLYKQAGNAIVVDVLEGIFRKLFLSKSKEKGNKLEEQLEWLDELLGVGT